MKRIPFYSNTSNDLRCVQAVLRMVLKAENLNYSYAQLDRLTKRKSREWTWNPPIQLAMNRLGFRCLLFEKFSYQQFAKQGRVYLNKTFGEEWTRTEARNTDLTAQRLWAKEMLKAIGQARRAASIKDIRRFFQAGYYVAPTVNAAKLQQQGGYINHLVLVTGLNKKFITLHDPGLPPHPNWKIPWTIFTPAFTGTLKAWRLDNRQK